MSDNFEQWFNSEFPDADLSQHETLKGYNNLKYGWNAALSSLQGEPFAYLCDWGDLNGLQRVAIYYGEPGGALEDDWNEIPKVHHNLPIFTCQPDSAAKIAELESELVEQSRLLGISAERELALQAKLSEVEKDAERMRLILSSERYAVCDYKEGRGDNQGRDDYEPVSIEVIDSAIQEIKKGDVLIARPNIEDL